ncbi:YdgA family protein [uncultured Desulfobacter sp.]|uniref:YdgA family protein n=1 Tax=uncultured Desulfobacter sp. TaxID=240139 RepID=UPI002AA95DE4|nr:YdgA family protein [uncultured Desulfobacter sp.]
MKKILIVFICLVVICAAGLPIANGIIMERTIKSAVVKNNKKAAKTRATPNIKILEYKRGLFSSRIKWRIENPGGLPGSDMGQLVLVNQATHGFFGVTSQTNLQETPGYMQWVNTHLNGKDPLSIQTQFSLTGTMVSTVQMNAFSIEEKGKKIDIHTLTLDVSTGKGFETLDAKGQWKGVSQGDEFVIGPVTFTSDLAQLTDIIWTGKNTFSLAQVKINDGKSDPVNLSGLNVNVSTNASEDKKTLTMVTDFHVDGIELGGKQLSDWAATFKVKQLDMAALEQGIVLYSDIMAKAGQRLEKAGGNPGNFQKILKAETTRNAPQLMSTLNGLLKKGLGIEIADLDIDLPEGKVAGSLDLNLKKDLDASNIFMFAMQPDMIFSFIELDAQLHLPYALAGGIPNLTEPLFPGMVTGFFVVQDDLLALDMHITDEKLFLNGNQVLLKQ